jgi:hypothetical protein
MYRETTFPLVFTGLAQHYINLCYNNYYQNGIATIRLVGKNYERTYILDFGTYKNESKKVDISCRVIDLRSLIKTNGNTEYDIPMRDITEPAPFKYKRIKLTNTLRMHRASTDLIQIGGVFGNNNGTTLGEAAWTEIQQFTLLDTDTPVKDYVSIIDDSTINPQGKIIAQIDKTGLYNISYISDCELVTMQTCFGKLGNGNNVPSYDTYRANLVAHPYRVRFTLYKSPTSNSGLSTELARFVDDCQLVDSLSSININGVDTSGFATLNIIWSSIERNKSLISWSGELVEDEVLYLGVTIESIDGLAIPPDLMWTSQIICIYGSGNVELTYKVANSVDKSYICTTVESVMKALLQRMGADFNFTCICNAPIIQKLILVPHDVPNGYVEPVLTISYATLLSLITTLCCTLDIDGNDMKIVSIYGIDGAFDIDKRETIAFNGNECADLKSLAYNDLLYSEINVGYTAKVPDGTNGKLEFNCSSTYVSKSNSTNKLAITTAIRADSVGFELSIPVKETDKNTRIKDVFVFDVELIDGVYQARNETNEGLKNININPATLLRLWLPILGMSSDIFVLASTTATTNVVDGINPDDGGTIIDPLNLKTNITIYENNVNPVMHPVQYDIATSDNKSIITQALINGYMQIIYEDVTYYGFVFSASENPLISANVEYLLIKKGGTAISYPKAIMVSTQTFLRPSYAHNFLIEFNVMGISDMSMVNITTDVIGIVATDITYFNNKIQCSINLTSNTSSTIKNISVFATFSGKSYIVAKIQQKHNLANPSIETYANFTLSSNGEMSEDNTKVTSNVIDLRSLTPDYMNTMSRKINYLGNIYKMCPTVVLSMLYDDYNNTANLDVIGRYTDPTCVDPALPIVPIPDFMVSVSMNYITYGRLIIVNGHTARETFKNQIGEVNITFSENV